MFILIVLNDITFSQFQTVDTVRLNHVNCCFGTCICTLGIIYSSYICFPVNLYFYSEVYAQKIYSFLV
jgi:dissimilatory sulfite reductase (desulfoviridin) alpha/beta subunit